MARPIPNKSALPTPASAGTGWCSLSVELQLQILEEFLRIPSSISAQKYEIFIKMRLQPLYWVHQHIGWLAHEVFCKINTFVLSENGHAFGCPKPWVNQLIRHLEVKIDVCKWACSWKGYFLSSQLQEKGFQNLRTVKIILVLGDENYHALNNFAKLLDEKQVTIKTERLEVVLSPKLRELQRTAFRVWNTRDNPNLALQKVIEGFKRCD